MWECRNFAQTARQSIVGVSKFLAAYCALIHLSRVGLSVQASFCNALPCLLRISKNLQSLPSLFLELLSHCVRETERQAELLEVEESRPSKGEKKFLFLKKRVGGRHAKNVRSRTRTRKSMKGENLD